MGVDFTYFQPNSGSENSFIYLLTAILALLSVISFIKSKSDILHPSFIYSICLTGCCSLAALYTPIWNLPMHFNTAMILIVMSLLFISGSWMAESYFNGVNNKTKRENRMKVIGAFHIGWITWGVFLILLALFAYLNYRDFLNVASQVTNETEFNKMLFPVIDGLAHQQIKFDRWYVYRMRFATGMAYISVLAVWLNLMTHQYKEVFKWFCFILLYLPFMILTGGRQQFMYLILFSMVSFFLVSRKNSVNSNSLGKELLIIGVAFITFLGCFLGIGVINGKIGSEVSFLRVLVNYAGINISAFDVFINEMLLTDTPYIGTTTLDPFYNFLNSHGFNVPSFSMYITMFTSFGPVTTNVYTAFYRYIYDYGYLGCALILFLLGFIYTIVYRFVYYSGMKNWLILVYASIAYPIFLIGREERFFNEIFTTSEVSFILEILVLYKLFDLLGERRKITE